jgi:hypothetical protein
MHCFLFKFLLGILETLLCSMSALQVKITPLLDALQLLMLFAGTLTYLEPKMFSSIIFYNDPNYMQHVCIYVLSTLCCVCNWPCSC